MSTHSDPTPDHFNTGSTVHFSDTDFDRYRFDCPECGERVRRLRDHTGGCPVLIDELDARKDADE